MNALTIPKVRVDYYAYFQNLGLSLKSVFRWLIGLVTLLFIITAIVYAYNDRVHTNKVKGFTALSSKVQKLKDVPGGLAIIVDKNYESRLSYLNAGVNSPAIFFNSLFWLLFWVVIIVMLIKIGFYIYAYFEVSLKSVWNGEAYVEVRTPFFKVFLDSSMSDNMYDNSRWIDD